MKTISFKVNLDEYGAIRFRMFQEGETNLSAYLRRLCLNGSFAMERQLATITAMLQEQSAAVEHSAKMTSELVALQADDIDLKLIAGLYMLLYPSVDKGVQATVDRYLDVSVIEKYLERGGKEKRFLRRGDD